MSKTRKMSDVAEVAENKLNVSVEKAPFIVEKANSVLEYSATTSAGQFIIRYVDKFLWTVENTAKWSLPQSLSTESDEKAIHPPPLIRPLPWLVFLPALIALRFLRTGLSLMLLMVGQGPVTPKSMVSSVQTVRRKIRAFKYHGLRVIRLKHLSQQNQRTLMSKVFNSLRVLLCLPRLEDDQSVKVTLASPANKSSNSNHKQVIGTSKRHAEDDSDSDPGNAETMRCGEMLDKFAGLESSEDSNFEINESSASSNSEEMSLEDSEVEVLMNKTLNAEEIETAELKKTPKSVNNQKLVTSSPRISGKKQAKTTLQGKTETPPEEKSKNEEKITAEANGKLSPKAVQNGVSNANDADDDVDATVEEPLNQISNAFLNLKRSSTVPIAQPKCEETFYSPIASPTADDYKSPDINYTIQNGEERSNFVALTPTLTHLPSESSSSVTPSPTSSNRSKKRHNKARRHKNRANNLHKRK